MSFGLTEFVDAEGVPATDEVFADSGVLPT